MIFLTLKYRGLANSSKNGLKRLIEVNNPSVIFLQELMIDEEKVVQDLSKLFGSWEFSYIDAIGRSRGNNFFFK
jgi:hypothetical protein